MRLAASGSLRVHFHSDGLNCASFSGVAMREYEYRRYESGGAPVWTPLRFPGQYWDRESDWFENWNRYYDPSIGRYLAPEPMMQNPKFLARQAMQGHGVNAYAYAMNNPLRYTDRNGLWPMPWEPGKLCVSASCKPRDTNSCRDLPENSPKQGNSGELKNLPAPGTCSDSDAVYMDSGVYKIPNDCKCSVECDSMRVRLTGMGKPEAWRSLGRGDRRAV